jgi:hypothetical protein
MPGTFLDVDAPNTNWRGSEDPIPVIFGRWPVTGALYRFATCRPLDGHARTDATFWHAGGRAFTRSGHTMPYNYWPGWKRGLLMTRLPAFGLAPWTAAVGLNESLHLSESFWWSWEAPALAWAPLLSYGGWRGVRYVQEFKHERAYVRPIRNAAIATLRTRDGIRVEVPRGMVHGADEKATGKIYLPTAHALHEGDRDNLLTIARERLGHGALDARWNMEGSAPHMELFTPPQPPPVIDWDTMMSHADTVSPYLGHAAGHPVSWDMSDDSPHIAVAGGSGSGKSELVAWIVAQLMRGGSGLVVLDPKYASHRWVMGAPGVLYCTEPQMLHDTILWLDEELRRRGRASQVSTDSFPRIVVLLEERNSMQTLLREHWAAVRPSGAPYRSPALTALDRLASQGRSLGIHVVLAAQETAQVHIGSRTSYGAFAIAGRMTPSAWRMVMGPGTKKPAISATPGRFGYVVGGRAVAFQAAYPDLKRFGARLLAYALGGDAPLNVQQLMQQQHTPAFRRWEAATAEDPTVDQVTLREYAERNGLTVAWLRSRADRDPEFPPPVGRGEKNAGIYAAADLDYWRNGSGGGNE